jgi:hypothetical protein
VEERAAVEVGVERRSRNRWRRDGVVAPGWLLVAAATFLELFAALVADGLRAADKSSEGGGW